MRPSRSLAAAVAASLALACSDSTSPKARDVATTIRVAAADTMLDAGGTTALTAVVLGKTGNTLASAPISWSTTDASAATVSASGVATAVAQGSAWLVASSGNARDSVQVMVGYRKISGPQPFATVSMFLQIFQPGDGCALTATGAAYCWGASSDGQLGNGSPVGTISATPVAVSGDLAFKEMEAGNKSVCGITRNDGTLYCWGKNAYAQFGTGSRLPTRAGVPLAGAAGLQFRTMSHSIDGTLCGVSSADAVLYCWGHDTYWTTAKDTASPPYIDSIVAPVTGSLTARQVSVGDLHGCAIGTDDATWCWGEGEWYGAATLARAPVSVAPAGTLTSVIAGEYSTCGLTAAGQALCWGDPPVAPGAYGGATVTTPTPVAGSLRFRKLSSSYFDYVCGLTLDGDIYCWGRNSSDTNATFRTLLGRPGGDVPASAPVPVLPGHKFVDVDESCGVDVAGDIYCWYQR